MKYFNKIFFILLIPFSKSILDDLESKKLCRFGHKITICQICCCENLASINCNDLRGLSHYSKRPISFEIDEAYFDGVYLTLSHLVIDHSQIWDIHFKLDHNLFVNIINLQKLTLIKVNITQVPNFENQLHLEELTIQEANLRYINTDFCLTNSRLKRIDFSFNELESNSIVNVFTNCDHLTSLDLSYNGLSTLENFITYVSSIVLLNLKNNKIKQINSDDLDFLIDLIELNLESNSIEIIYENAFFSLNKLRKLNLRNNKLEEFNDDDMVNLESIDLSLNRLKKINSDFCTNKNQLKRIFVSNNKFQLEDLVGVFDECTSLLVFEIENNELNSVNRLFSRNMSLTRFNLRNNKITAINETDFKYLINLETLNLSGNKISFIHKNAFDSLKRLTWLDLSRNKLVSLPETSLMYSRLESFDVSDNSLLVEFPGVKQFYKLTTLRVHYPYHCCQFLQKNNLEFDYIDYDSESYEINEEMDDSDIIVNETDLNSNQTYQIEEIHHGIITAAPIEPNELEIMINEKKNRKKRSFVCTPEPDHFQPCENLLDGWWLRSSVWFISLMGILSNLMVVAFNILYLLNYYYSNVDIHVPAFLLTNLAIADSLMAIYLLFIAIKDNTSRSNFGKSALEWQNSISCNLAGFLSISSTVSSALCLVFITFERYYAIKNSINFNKRISFRFALITIIIIWMISFIFSFLPLIDINSYSKYAICLPLDTRGNSYQAYVISLNAVFIASFVFMCIFYAMVFLNTSFRKRKTSIDECNDQLRVRNAEDQRLARNILLLLTVNIMCWGPVVIFNFYSLIRDNQMNRFYIKLIAVFVIPFNSLINPFLYCLSRKIFRAYVEDYFTKYRFKRNLENNLSFKSSTFSSYSCKRNSHKSSIITNFHRNSNTNNNEKV